MKAGASKSHSATRKQTRRGYRTRAHQAGATEAELIEFLNVAVTESGCPGEQWTMMALKAYGNLDVGVTADADICCGDKDAPIMKGHRFQM